MPSLKPNYNSKGSRKQTGELMTVKSNTNEKSCEKSHMKDRAKSCGDQRNDLVINHFNAQRTTSTSRE